ncbi:MAG: hypothetical protein JO254_16235 [Pseudolabrys sp.]|nr:hypothetical protein [Pseudolabrys sp.]
MATMQKAFVVLLALIAAPAGALSATIDDPTNIMRPEPGSRDAAFEAWHQKHPKVQRRTHPGSSNPVYPAALPKPDHFVPTPSLEARPSGRTVQPYYADPTTGRVTPNISPGVVETGQDRALRCAHQAGVNAPNVGDRNAYIGGCINQ